MSNKPKKEKDSFWGVLTYIVEAAKNEATTTAGRFNLLFDVLLAAIVGVTFAANAIETVGIALSSIWNIRTTQYLSDSTVLTAFIILVVFSLICLFFIAHHENKMKK